MGTYADHSIDLLTELAQAKGSDAVLDYACGVGEAAFALAPLAGAVEAVDEEAGALDEGRRLSADLGLTNITFTLVDLYALPYDDGAFSLVVCRNALHRLPDALAALHEMTRVLRQDGRLIMYDAVVDAVSDRSFNELARLRQPAHRRYQRREEFVQLIAAAGLRLVAERTARRTVDLDYWLEAAAVPAEKAALIRTRFQALPVDVQASLDVAFADRLVSFSHDVLAVRIER
ncbi:MAG: class I SAM-dependent methyltransferase [Thermoleophilia bacterium]